MSIDQAAIERLRRFEDRGAGFSEEFIQADLGMGRSVGVLSRPLTDQLPVGWVVCHSFGIEQIHLGRLDVIAARTLSAAGFPVLRFHGQGYGDAEGGMENVGLSSHLAESLDAVEFLRAEVGIDSVGVMGARFGGAIAALVADRLDLPFMALWEPMVNGGTFMKEFLRSQLLSGITLTGEGGGTADLEAIRDNLAKAGWADIKGFRLSKQAHDDIAAVNLLKDVRDFRGSALVIALTRGGNAGRGLSNLSTHLRSLGASCDLNAISDTFAPQFGQFRWRSVEGGRSKRDIQLALNEKIAEATASWAVSLAQPQSLMEAQP